MGTRTLILKLLHFLFHGFDTRLHKGRFATLYEEARIKTREVVPVSLLLGVSRVRKRMFLVRPTQKRRELGNLLVVAPTRGGKGLLATTQLLTWEGSVIVNDIKGDLYQQTAGYRSTLGKVFVIDPEGYGNVYDPLEGKYTEDELYNAATRLLYKPDEGNGAIFTQRATAMLTQLFLAARIENHPPFPYVRQMIRTGLQAVAERLQQINPGVATQFLDVSYKDADFSDRFLLSAWGTLTARMRPLLTETVIKSLAGADITPEELLTSDKPVTIYFRWPEISLLSLSPLVRLLWGSLIDELTRVYDRRSGKGCQPVLLLIDEAGRTAIPALADSATTVVGRGISLWIAIQSLSQLEAIYGKERSQVLKDNMESQIYYRPSDLATAEYLEHRLGRKSGYAQSETIRTEGDAAHGKSEQGTPLLTAQQIMQMRDNDILLFHRNIPPIRAKRVTWLGKRVYEQRRNIPVPQVASLPEIVLIGTSDFQFVDPDETIVKKDEKARDVYRNGVMQRTEMYREAELSAERR